MLLTFYLIGAFGMFIAAIIGGEGFGVAVLAAVLWPLLLVVVAMQKLIKASGASG